MMADEPHAELHAQLRARAQRLWWDAAAQAPGPPVLARFMADWPAAAAGPPRRPGLDIAGSPGEAAPVLPVLPVLRWLHRIAADADGAGADFVRALCGAQASLDWRQTYTRTDIDALFLHNYAWAEILKPGAPSDQAQISCGVLVLGPNTFYPRHRHEAEEIYLPLAGTAEWQQGTAAWRLRPPGTVIHHSSEEPHAMRTGEQPLLAMYLWRSTDLNQHARLDRQGAG